MAEFIYISSCHERWRLWLRKSWSCGLWASGSRHLAANQATEADNDAPWPVGRDRGRAAEDAHWTMPIQRMRNVWFVGGRWAQSMSPLSLFTNLQNGGDGEDGAGDPARAEAVEHVSLSTDLTGIDFAEKGHRGICWTLGQSGPVKMLKACSSPSRYRR